MCLRKGVASILLLPMFISGLAMVCGEPGSSTGETGVTAVVSENLSFVCDGTMCRMMSMIAGSGAICLVSSSGAGIAVFDLGLAIPCHAVDIRFLLPVVHEPTSEYVPLYTSPSLSSLTPPPEA